MRIKQGDFYVFEYTLCDSDETAIDITDAVVTIKVVKDDTDEVIIDDQPCDEVVPTLGKIRYTFKSTETADVGMYKIEFKIVFFDGTSISVPSNDVLWLFIVPSLRSVVST
jgi:hypothetical protein